MEGDEAAMPASDRLWRTVHSFSGRGPKGYRRSDERIREEVCESLMKHPGIDASEFEVTVKDGVVTLVGTVPDRWMKRASEWVVDGVSGVRDIRNELNIL
jgi:osmotically-inducible protein OsmY